MGVFNILDYGAKADGTMCTAAIQNAINACSREGGTVLIPAGTYMSGTLELFSNMTLYLEAGAVLKGSPDMRDYPGYGYIHNELGEVRGLLHADFQENVNIAGEGEIDFNGDAFYDYSRPMVETLEVDALSETQKQEFVVYYKERPNQMIFFHRCKNIRVRDVVLRNAACWGLVFDVCEQVKVDEITIRFGIRLPNDDGIHVISCRNVLIKGCDIVAGDDCIALSGIDAWMVENNNIIISDCLLSSSSAGIRIGYWNSRVRNCQIHNCRIYDANRGICIMSCPGGYVENIQISGLQIETRSRVGGWWGSGEAVYIVGLPHGINLTQSGHEKYDETPRKVNISNIMVRDLAAECESGIVIAGDDYNISGLHFYNITVKIKDGTNREYFGNRLDLAPGNTVKELEEGKVCWLYAEEVENVTMEDVTVTNGMIENKMEVAQYVINCKGMKLPQQETAREMMGK